MTYKQSENKCDSLLTCAHVASRVWRMKNKTATYEVTTAGNVLLIGAASHDEAKALAEKEGHRVLASQHGEYVNDLKIYDEKGYAEACE